MLECSLARTHSSLHSLEKGNVVALKEGSFKKDQVLITRNNQPFFIAPSDGHYFDEYGMSLFIFYAEDKPPMKLDVLKRLPWPQYKDVLAFRNSELKKDAMISQGKQQIPDVNIILDSRKQNYYPFFLLKPWMQSFKLDKYDPAEIERLKKTLKREAPNVTLFNTQRRSNDKCVAFPSSIHSHPTKFDHCTYI